MKTNNFIYRQIGFLMAVFAIARIVFIIYNAHLGMQSWTDVPMACVFGLLQDLQTSLLLLMPVALVSWAMRKSKISLRKALIPYYALVSLAVALILAGDMVMYEFWQFKLSAVVLSYAASPEGASSSVSTWFIASRLGYCFLLGIIMCCGLACLTPKRDQHASLIRSMVVVVLGALTFIFPYVGSAYHSERLFVNHAAVNPVYQFMHSFHVGEELNERYAFLDTEECETTFQGLYPTDTEDVTDTLLNTQRPNILVVFMESFGGKFVQELGGVPNVSVNISGFIPQSIFWENYYSNSFRTDRGTVSAFSGYLSYPDVGLMRQTEFHSMLPSLARSLSKAGYETSYVYGGAMTNMGKRKYLEDMGFQHLIDYTAFSKEELNSSWGAHDANSAKKTFFTLLDKEGQEQPWFMVWQTISSHEPWDVPYDRLNDKVLNAFAYTDQCVGDLVNAMKGLYSWDNTLVIIIPDHGYLYQQSYEDSEFFHSPMLWMGGAIKEPRHMSVLMNQSDLCATLLSQMGINHSEYEWSRNVLSKNYTNPFVYSNFPAGLMFKDNTGTTMYDVTAQRVIKNMPEEGSEERVRKAEAILQQSYNLLQKGVEGKKEE